MTGAQARAIRRTADGDAQWFTDHPDRSYRLRPASPVEITVKLAAMGARSLPAGFQVYAAIWQIKPHSRCTALCLREATTDDDSEEKAAAMFVLAASRATSTSQ